MPQLALLPPYGFYYQNDVLGLPQSCKGNNKFLLVLNETERRILQEKNKESRRGDTVFNCREKRTSDQSSCRSKVFQKPLPSLGNCGTQLVFQRVRAPFDGSFEPHSSIIMRHLDDK